MLEINDIEVKGKTFAYDGCHKIYIIESEEERGLATECGYDILPIDQLEKTYRNSCDLKFISNWSLDKRYVRQSENANFQKGGV